MRQLPSSLAPAGCSPARLNPLSPAPVNNQGQRLTDLMAMQRLFANGEQGGYWPADPEYLFEDSAGTIPASVNGVVGLWLDVSQELRTVELIINGNNENSAFNALANKAYSNLTESVNSSVPGHGQYAQYVSNSSSNLSHRGYIANPSRMTRVSGWYYVPTGGVSRFSVYDVNDGSWFGFSGTQKDTWTYFSVIRPAKNTIWSVGYGNNQSDVITSEQIAFLVDDLSIVEIYGNHAVQATTVNKPDLRKTPVSNKVWLNSNVATGALTVTFSGSLGSACTVATVGAEGVTIADNQTVGTTYNLCPPYGYNGGVLIINRALTTAEKALVTRVMGWNVPTLGSELISNGEFENWSAGAPVGWTLSSQNANNYVVEVSPGRARLVCDNAIAVYVQKSMPLGIKYCFTTATITELISGSAKITLVNGSAEKVFSSTGVISMVGKTTATDYFQVRRNAACNVVVDRVSVKEIF